MESAGYLLAITDGDDHMIMNNTSNLKVISSQEMW